MDGLSIEEIWLKIMKIDCDKNLTMGLVQSVLAIWIREVGNLRHQNDFCTFCMGYELVGGHTLLRDDRKSDRKFKTDFKFRTRWRIYLLCAANLHDGNNHCLPRFRFCSDREMGCRPRGSLHQSHCQVGEWYLLDFRDLNRQWDENWGVYYAWTWKKMKWQHV